MIGGASGLVFAFVVVLWVAYVVPLALRRYDDAGKSATLESAGALGRVIRRAAPAATTAEEPATEAAPAAATPVRTLDRPAARLAARRRRRVLITLLTVLVVVCGLAVAGVVGVVWTAAPVGLVGAWLVACRVQVRGERGIGRAASPARRPERREQAAPAVSVDDEETVVITGLYEDVDPGRVHVMESAELEVDALDEQLTIAVPSASVTTGEALWDPLPVTLPTYVTKPRAGRTVRTIDFGQPGTWTSGHVEGEDVDLPARSEGASGEGDARAVGH